MAALELRNELLCGDEAFVGLAKEYDGNSYMNPHRQLELLAGFWQASQLEVPDITSSQLDNHERLTEIDPSRRLNIAPMLDPADRTHIRAGVTVFRDGLYGSLVAAQDEPVDDETHIGNRQTGDVSATQHTNVLRYMDQNGKFASPKQYGALLLQKETGIVGSDDRVWAVTSVAGSGSIAEKTPTPRVRRSAHDVVKGLDLATIPEILIVGRCLALIGGKARAEHGIFLSREVIQETRRNGKFSSQLRGVVGVSSSGDRAP